MTVSRSHGLPKSTASPLDPSAPHTARKSAPGGAVIASPWRPVLDREAVVADDPTQRGRWDPVVALPDVAIHTHVLPTGKVLFWGRRKDPKGGMHQQGCAPFVWNPAT